MDKMLSHLTSQLNELKVLYGLGGSMMLKLSGFKLTPKDIDFVVSEKDFEKVFDLLSNIATFSDTKSKESFKTQHFASFIIEDCHIDVMASFAYEHRNGVYTAIFDEESVVNTRHENNSIPIMTLEEWYVMYSVMQRGEKAQMIEAFWKQNGIKYPHLLTRQLSLNLPNELVTKIYDLISLNEKAESN